MNIVPQDTFKSQVSTDQDKSVLSSAVPSLPDTLRQQEGGAVPLSTQLNDRHPLESTLKNWETTQRQRQGRWKWKSSIVPTSTPFQQTVVYTVTYY